MSLKDWSITESGNNLTLGIQLGEGVTPFANMNNAARQIMADTRLEVAGFGTVVAAASTPDIGIDGGVHSVSGTTSIAGFASAPAGLLRILHFETATPLINSTALGLPGGASFTTARNDVGAFRSVGSGLWKCEYFTRADGAPLFVASAAETRAGTNATKPLTPASPVGLVHLETQVASGSSSIDFVLTSWLSAYRAFKFVLTGVNPATDAVNLFVRTSTNGGSSYDIGASDYSWLYLGRTDAAASFDANDAADNEIEIANSIGNGAAEDLDGEVTLSNPAGTTFHKKIRFNTEYVAASGALSWTTGTGRRVATADVDAVRFVMSSGNIAAGTFALYGIK